MNDLQHEPDDWATLGEDWRAQAASRVDAGALLDEVRRRGSRLRRALVLELATAAAALGLCAWVLLDPETHPAYRLLVAALATVVLVLQGWALWIRRGQIRERGLGPEALVELDIRRARTTLRYWRVSTWATLVVWLVLYAFSLVGAVSNDAALAGTLYASLGATAVVVVVAAAWGWWRGRMLRQRLQRMRRMQAELREQ
ncbi:MAG: hypothetical protein M3Q40_05235 [Pseudomonadota bacterium]|nr:hypothetical protein [Pseudomonadota bacterium]